MKILDTNRKGLGILPKNKSSVLDPETQLLLIEPSLKKINKGFFKTSSVVQALIYIPACTASCNICNQRMRQIGKLFITSLENRTRKKNQDHVQTPFNKNSSNKITCCNCSLLDFDFLPDSII